MQKSIGKWEIRPPCKIVTPKDFNLTLHSSLRDYVGVATHYAILVLIALETMREK